MKGLEIGKAIYNILIELGNINVYPLVADNGAKFPFIVYRRTGLVPSNTKDRYNYQELATVEIIIAADNYQDSIQNAVRVKGCLEKTRGRYNNVDISEIKLIGASEEYLDNAFVQKLTFAIEIL